MLSIEAFFGIICKSTSEMMPDSFSSSKLPEEIRLTVPVLKYNLFHPYFQKYES
jgi:hypothetical protein